MQRRLFLASLAVAPLAKDVLHPTEAQLLGMSEEEYGDADTDTGTAMTCAICSTVFEPTDAQIVIGASAQLIVACPQCRVLQMAPTPENA